MCHPGQSNTERRIPDAPLVQYTRQRAIFIPILSDSAVALNFLQPQQQAVFISSNNVEIDTTAPVYQRLRAAESRIRSEAPNAIILRPTMIFGYPGDGKLSRLLTEMRRWPILPYPAAISAPQQPVYYRDLATVIAETLFDKNNLGKTIAVSGPDSVSYHSLLASMAKADGLRCLLVPW